MDSGRALHVRCPPAFYLSAGVLGVIIKQKVTIQIELW